MGKYFGTDGFRGEVNKTLTAEQAYHLGRFTGLQCAGQATGRPRLLLGKDTRLSGYMLEYAFAAGAMASGADVILAHVTTTPSLSWLIGREGYDAGVMISASHNPFTDNGIKILNRRGEKTEEEVLLQAEAYLDSMAAGGTGSLPAATGEAIGRAIDAADARERYISHLASLAEHRFEGFRIGLDCANGSAWELGKKLFSGLGASVVCIHDTPNGTNINRDAGSTHPQALQELVQKEHLDAGFAFDGDADRCLAVDENGTLVTGDHLLYLFALAMKEKGTLHNNTVVTTVMSNLGLYRALQKQGIGYVQTDVGDKYVYEEMRKNGYALGGEQSGHIILLPYANTGDGLLTALMALERMAATKRSLSELTGDVTLYPQLIRNISVANKKAIMKNPAVLKKVRELAAAIGKQGRILLRESGTEPVIRIMAEGENDQLCAQWAEAMTAVIKREALA